MILHRSTFRGVGTPFRHATIDIPWDLLPDGLIAICGKIGVGKSTLIESSWFAPVYRHYPFLGVPFSGLILPGVRDAFAETTFTIGGRTLRVRVQCDPQWGGGRGKTEAYVHDVTAGKALAGPNVRDADAVLATIVPERDLVLASAFAAQGWRGQSAGLFALTPGNRRSLFSGLLGLARYQVKAEQARERARGATAALSDVRAKLDEARARAARAVTAASALLAAKYRAETCTTDLAGTQEVITWLGEQQATLRVEAGRRTAEAAAIAARNAERQQAYGAAHAEYRDLVDRCTALEAVLARAQAIETAVAETARLGDLIEQQRTALAEVDARLQPLETARATTTLRVEHLQAEHARLTKALDAAEAAAARLTGEADIAAGIAQQEDARAAALAAGVEARTRYDQADLALQEEQRRAPERATLRQAQERHAKVAGLLGALEEPENPLCGRCPFTQDARAAAAETGALTTRLEALGLDHLAAAKEARAAALAETRRHDQARETAAAALEILRQQEADLAADQALAAELPRLRPERETTATMLAEARKVLNNTAADAATVAGQAATLRTALTALQAQRDGHTTLAAEYPILVAARAEHGALAARRDTVAAQLATPPVLEPLPEALTDQLASLAAQRTAAEQAARDATTALREAETARDRLAGELQALGDPAADVVRLDAEETRLAGDVAEWAILDRDLGPTGVQALDLEMAGPTVTARVNDLLHACYGTRFTFALETVAEKKSGGGTKEIFEPRILDAETGRVGDQGSGGEQAIIDEAVRLGIALYHQERSGADLRTLFRDEVTGAFDAENADAYVAMLRRAQELGSFHRVLFITHQESLAAQADARILIDKAGAVTFDPPLAVREVA